MKKIFLLAFLLCAIDITLNAQSNEDSAKVEIKQLTQEWNKAIIKRDSMALVKVMSPDYTINGTFPLKDWMNNVLHHLTTDSLQILSEQKITVFEDIASSEALWYWKASFDGKPTSNTEYWVNDIWKKNNGHWQVFLRMKKISKRRS